MVDKPLIVQSDLSLLLDVHSSSSEATRNDLLPFAELVKSPEHVHTYAVTNISLWNAASLGIDSGEVLRRLEKWSRYPLPENVIFHINEIGGRFGSIKLLPYDEENYLLEVEQERFRREIMGNKSLAKSIGLADNGFIVPHYRRGEVKVELIKMNLPVDDQVPLNRGESLPITFREVSKGGIPFILRDYQRLAAYSVLGDGGPGSGYGTIVLPCGSGKTIVGMEIMSRLSTRTLILTTNIAAIHQWMAEIVDKLDVDENLIGEYSGKHKEIKPITVATYQVLTWRPDKEGDFPHMRLLREGNWGLIIYDEVHMLPAPVFKITAELQAIYRVGLTATLIREDNREGEVFSLVGPKRYDVPWSELESQGWIAEAICTEIRVPLPEDLEIPYAIGTKREKYRIASENRLKIEIVKELIANHSEDFILVIGQYLDQLKIIAQELNAPLITGALPTEKREELYNSFRGGEIKLLVVSKVANFAIDLPDASVAIQVSGTFGSRQEEAQRLGRILRPKQKSSYFYTLVTRYSSEEDFSANRQKFLTEQGYSYRVEVWQ
ncbi:MAG: DNA repair helicase XPB [Sphaerochaetaceae bacterium]|jgi:DNA excision repair protein ERCC-3|nr:helicase-associated domain-containing protein [Sphaerochaetaceae bacterium]